MEAMATALRERGFEIVVSADSSAAVAASVEVILIFAGAAPSSVIVAINKYRLLYPSAIVVLVGSDYADDELVFLIEAGVQAYTSANASLEELVHTITAVQRGESTCSPQLGALVAARIALLARSPKSSLQPSLTGREKQILQLVAAGLSNKEIAQQLSISLHTVKIHVHRILEKLQVRRRREAARWIHIHARASSA
jgi:DNA-binding NarL/FixJ family response regulator